MSTDRFTYRQIISNSTFRTKRLGYVLLEPIFLTGRVMGAISLWIGHLLTEVGDKLKSDSTTRLAKSFETEQTSDLTWRPFIICVSVVAVLVVWTYVNIDNLPFINNLDQMEVPDVLPIDSTIQVDTPVVATTRPTGAVQPSESKHKSPVVSNVNMIPFVKRFFQVAIDESKIFGIPASIKMGQAIIESGYGKGTLVRHNNYFSVKCFGENCPKGHCINHHDDSSDDRFRVYQSAWYSWRAHSHFLKRDRYTKCFDCKEGDYKCWARELASAGYATDPKYGDKLIRVIEQNRLYELDR